MLKKRIDSLKPSDIKIYPIYEKVYHAIENKEMYAKLTALHQHYELPLVFKENNIWYAISHIEDIEAANLNGIELLEVEVRDIPEAQRIPMLMLTTLHKKKEYKAISVTVEILEEFFKTPEGVQYGKKLTNTKDIVLNLAATLGLSETMIKNYRIVGTKYRHLLQKVNNQEWTWEVLLLHIKADKNKAIKPQDDHEDFDNDYIEPVISANSGAKGGTASTTPNASVTPSTTASLPNLGTVNQNADAGIVAQTSGTSASTGSINDEPIEDPTNTAKECSDKQVVRKSPISKGSINLSSGLAISFDSSGSECDLAIDGKDYAAKFTSVKSGDVLTSTITLNDKPDVIIRIIMENVDKLD
jgi:hypothetical protein